MKLIRLVPTRVAYDVGLTTPDSAWFVDGRVEGREELNLHFPGKLLAASVLVNEGL